MFLDLPCKLELNCSPGLAIGFIIRGCGVLSADKLMVGTLLGSGVDKVSWNTGVLELRLTGK